MFTTLSEPFALQVFGASGHLASSKLYPALFELYQQHRLPEQFVIIGYGRTPLNFQKCIADSLHAPDTSQLEQFLTHVRYVQGAYDSLEDYYNVTSLLDTLLPQNAARLCYFAVPPKVFGTIVEQLAQSRRHQDEDIRLIMEKPFGEDTASATQLYHLISRSFAPESCYLLDHYLGKTAVQSILHLRHKNRILDILLRSEHIANIQITAFEQEGILSRAPYYEGMGALKDMLQSHLLQLLALTTMAIPLHKSAESIHRERANMLESLYSTGSPDDLVLGQYESYRQEADVAPDSDTETFVAGRFFIDQEQWHNIPIYIRTGKKLSAKETRIVITFKKFSFQASDEAPNRLIFSIYPDESLRMTLENQYNSFDEQTLSTIASSSIACVGDDCLSEHGRLLLKIFTKEQSYFLSFPEILASWKLTEQLLRHRPELLVYPDGSTGPEAHLELPLQDGFTWY